jgi:hypothetical protein
MAKSWEKMTTDEKTNYLHDHLRTELANLNRKAGIAMGHAEDAHIKLRELEKKIDSK